MVSADLDSVELHDALIEDININFLAASVTIQIAYYPAGDSQQRVKAKLIFENVESISQLVDLVRLRQNATAGNVNYWRSGDASGPTYIYLVDGCIAVSAKIIRIDLTSSAS